MAESLQCHAKRNKSEKEKNYMISLTCELLTESNKQTKHSETRQLYGG